MKIFYFTFYLFLLLAVDNTLCFDKKTQETAKNKQSKLAADYQKALDLINKCKMLIASNNDFDKYKGRLAIGGVSQIAVLYEIHVAFNTLLAADKKKLTIKDREAISKYLVSKSYSQENQALIESYLNCLLEEQSASYDIHSPQQGHINIPKKCHPLDRPFQKTMAKENLTREGIQIDEDDLFF